MSVYKHGNRWYVDIKIRGRRYRQAVPEARTRKQAEEAERRLRDQIFEGRFAAGRSNQPPRLSDFIDQKYMPYSRTRKKSWKSDAWRSDVLKKYLGEYRLDEITPEMIDEFRADYLNAITIRGTRRSEASVDRCLQLLSSIFSLARRSRLVSGNPVLDVEKFNPDNRRHRYLTSEEETRLMNVLTEKRSYLKSVVILALNTGMRRGEILSLEWQQVDFVRNTILVTRTKSRVNRIIPMNPLVRNELWQRSEQRSESSQYVFESPKKAGAALKEPKKSFKAALAEAGIEGFRFHDLRHTAGTRLAELGVGIEIIRDILGHADIRTTMIYVHAVDHRKYQAVQVLAGYRDKVGQNSPTKDKEQAE